jgi:hypothetical protein
VSIAASRVFHETIAAVDSSERLKLLRCGHCVIDVLLVGGRRTSKALSAITRHAYVHMKEISNKHKSYCARRTQHKTH